jgi:hypothetical protein
MILLMSLAPQPSRVPNWRTASFPRTSGPNPGPCRKRRPARASCVTAIRCAFPGFPRKMVPCSNRALMSEIEAIRDSFERKADSPNC